MTWVKTSDTLTTTRNENENIVSHSRQHETIMKQREPKEHLQHCKRSREGRRSTCNTAGGPERAEGAPATLQEIQRGPMEHLQHCRRSRGPLACHPPRWTLECLRATRLSRYWNCHPPRWALERWRATGLGRIWKRNPHTTTHTQEHTNVHTEARTYMHVG